MNKIIYKYIKLSSELNSASHTNPTKNNSTYSLQIIL